MAISQDDFAELILNDPEEVERRILASKEGEWLSDSINLIGAGKNNMTPLHHVAALGNTSLIKLLLSKNVYLNPPDVKGRTPIDIALVTGNFEAFDLLLNAGANLSIDTANTALIWSVRHKNLARAEAVIGKADVNATDTDGVPFIHYVVNTGNIDMVKLFMKNGVELHKADADGITPLHHVYGNQNRDKASTLAMAQFLMDNGADVTASSKRGTTPLGISSQPGAFDPELVRILLNNTDNLDAKNANYLKKLAIKYNDPELVKIIDSLNKTNTEVKSSPPESPRGINNPPSPVEANKTEAINNSTIANILKNKAMGKSRASQYIANKSKANHGIYGIY